MNEDDEKNEILDDIVVQYPFITDVHKYEFSKAFQWSIEIWYKYIPFIVYPSSRYTTFVYQIILKELIRRKLLMPLKQFHFKFVAISLWADAPIPLFEKFDYARMEYIYNDSDNKIHPQQWMVMMKNIPPGLWNCGYCGTGSPCHLQKSSDEPCDMNNGTHCHIPSGLHFCRKHGFEVMDVRESRFGIYDQFFLNDGRICGHLGVLQIISKSSIDISISLGNENISLLGDVN